MHSEILGGIPLLILILGALYTRRIIEPACLASVVAVVMRYGTDFVNGYLEKMYQVLSDPSFQLLIIVGNEEVIAAMVRNDRQQRRYSGLKLRLEKGEADE